MSSSAVVAVTVLSARASNPSSEPDWLILIVITESWSPSISTPSLTPVTVTVCGVFQFPAVNVSEAGAIVASSVSADAISNTTLFVG